MILSVTVDPIFGRYAVLLSVIAGILELVPIIGPIIAAVPAVLLAATAGLESVVAALVLYTLVQQLENHLLVPKIQGDAVSLPAAAVIFAIIIGGALAGLIGAILALPIAAAIRDVTRYLFRRLSPDHPEALAESIARAAPRGTPGVTAPKDPYKILQVDPEAEDEVIVAAYRRLARKYHPDVAEGADAAARMSAINAAWELIGEPDRRAAYDRDRAVSAAMARRDADAAAAAGPRSTATPPRSSTTTKASSPPRPREPEVVSSDWTSGRSTVGGGYDPSMRAPDGTGAAGTPPGNAVGERPELRALCRLVAGRDRPQRPRLHRVAGPDADRPAVSRRARCDPAADRAARAQPRPMRPTDGACSGAAECQPPRGRLRLARLRPAWGPPTPAGTAR